MLNPVTASASAMSDADLDLHYDAYRAVGDIGTATVFGSEIIKRLATPTGYIKGLVGVKQFPLYEQWTGFSASDAAQGSTSDAIGALADKAVSAGDSILGFGKNALLIIGVVLTLLTIIYIFVRYGGKK